MPRIARNVFPGIPHHITQRGNRREDVFFNDQDRLFYLQWLSEYSQKFAVDIMSYCLMTNHVHLVLRPATEEGLERVLKPLHMRYAQRINRAKGWKGHLWQGRFFSSPLDEAYTWSAIRYVERNPLRAGMVERAEDYLWSSAAARCGCINTPFLSPLEQEGPVSSKEWSSWLALPESDESISTLRQNVEKGLPCGDKGFVSRLEKLAGRPLRYRPQGRPFSNKG